MEYSNITILVDSKVTGFDGKAAVNFDVHDGLIVPADASASLETLVRYPVVGGDFPPRVGAGLTSALMDTAKHGEVGASGVPIGVNQAASAYYEQKLTNRGNKTPVRASFTIPGGETSFWFSAGSDGQANFLLKSIAEAVLNVDYIKVDDKGEEVVDSTTTPLLYTSFVNKQFLGTGLAALNADFIFPAQANARTFDVLTPFQGNNGRTAGVRWDEFTVEVLLGILDTGESVNMKYSLTAELFGNNPNAVFLLGDGQGAMQALIGDPFDGVANWGGFSIVVDRGATAVASPSTLLLLALGLVCLGARGTKAKIGQAVRCPQQQSGCLV
jgi:hypothetical protein